jgi:hypothetical protein
MKIFVSSLITGMEPIRAAAREAIIQLGHEPVMAEDLGAQPASPQIACLQGLRQSAAAILILGADYGAKQPSGLSPTHEEYREAKDKRPVFAFVQDGVNRDPDQASFVNEVQAWDSGLFRDGFSSPNQLRAKITLRLHEWEVATMAGPVDEQEMLHAPVPHSGGSARIFPGRPHTRSCNRFLAAPTHPEADRNRTGCLPSRTAAGSLVWAPTSFHPVEADHDGHRGPGARHHP